MKFLQNKKDGSCRVQFSDAEIKILNEKKELYLSPESLKHMGNWLMKIVHDWQMYFNKDIQNKQTFDTDEIEGK
tara:strand:- start:171 stop:392 length:222 start_codon:yes stop_codon:yes gene_type:complete